MRRHLFPWIALEPSNWRMYKVCPEIRWHITESAKFRVRMLAWIILIGPFFVLSSFLEETFARLSVWFGRLEPDMNLEVIADAHSILPINEIRKRLGKEPLPEPVRHKTS